jgi:hypothetical protein
MRYTPKAVSMWNIRFEMILNLWVWVLKTFGFGVPNRFKAKPMFKIAPLLAWPGDQAVS